jgi:hypothetical protein
MNRTEALEVLSQEIKSWRVRSYSELASLIGAETHTVDVTGSSGVVYHLTVQAFWDSKPGRNVRVLGCVDDGGLRAFVPLSDSFIMARDGTFVGE